MTIKPKPYNYLSIEEVKEWLKIKATDTSNDNIVQRLINTACDMVEKYIDGPVMSRQVCETHDGNASNVIVPNHYPVRSVDEIRIDFNRAFTDATKLEPVNFVLRGMPEVQQVLNKAKSPFIQIRGQDIVLRDDNNTAILGRIFSGSVVASIEMKYHAGWADKAEDLPSDLTQATMMLVEHLYITWDQRLIGIKSRNSMQQGFTRESGAEGAAGMPKEVASMLDQYKDYNFGQANVPQHNIFQL